MGAADHLAALFNRPVTRLHCRHWRMDMGNSASESGDDEVASPGKPPSTALLHTLSMS